MAKNKVSEYSSTAASNTDIGGIDIAEGCAPSGINNAIRELMSQVKDMQAGTDGDPFAVGGNLTVTGTTTLTDEVTATAGITGNLTGNVTGNVAGNVTGNLISVTNTITSGSFIIGNTYVIATLGTTDFTLIGASANTVGIRFTATGIGTGTGTATTFTGRAVNVSGIVTIENGGTGVTSFTQNAVIVGNGISSPTSVLPSTNGNFLKSTVGNTVTAGSFIVGTQYTILTVGTTNFTSIGAVSNTIGVMFIATGIGTGDGTVTTNVWSSQTPITPWVVGDVGSTTSITTSFTAYSITANTLMVLGTAFHATGSSKGSSLGVRIKNSAGTTLFTYTLTGGNELNGVDAGSGMSTRGCWSVATPAESIGGTLEFFRVSGGNPISLTINQVVRSV